ncbi:hypothetical protein DFP73DRAFT_496060 [Morchella snyderi]|nr:hypothetical protein DFP73DRAFT_496060 [Morchella snyderi]
MPAGRRRHPSSEVLIPIALGLTAAIASVGLYLWPDTESNYSSSSDEDRKKVRSRRRLKSSRRRFREHDRISEEDTDDLEEDRRRDEERLRLKGKHTNTVGAVVAGAITAEKKVEHAVVDVVEKAKGLAFDVLPAKKAPEAVIELKKEASTEKPQYVPPPAKKKSVAVVVSERKALEGHDSDSDFEETGLPMSLLSYLQYPLDLSMTEMNILIYSPHLSTHPLTHFTETQSARLARRDSASQPVLRRAASALATNTSTYNIATSLLPASYPLEHILPFTDSTSITPLLRVLAPEVVYIEELITIPSSGDIVAGLLEGGWVGSVVIVLVGEDDQFAGLIDSDDEEESPVEMRKSKGEGRWWGDNSPGGIRARFGGRVQVVEGWVLADDWRRRIEERG